MCPEPSEQDSGGSGGGGVAEGTWNLGSDSGEGWQRWSFLQESSLINPLLPLLLSVTYRSRR